MELSPNYAGTLVGMTTTFANVAGFLGPLFVGEITNNNVITGIICLFNTTGSKFTKLLKQIRKIFLTLGLNISRLIRLKVVFKADSIKNYVNYCNNNKFPIFHE